jgi:hypothetical protein
MDENEVRKRLHRFSGLMASTVHAIYMNEIIHSSKPKPELYNDLVLVDYPAIQIGIIHILPVPEEILAFLVDYPSTSEAVRLEIASKTTSHDLILKLHQSASHVVSRAALYNKNAPANIQMLRIKDELVMKINK